MSTWTAINGIRARRLLDLATGVSVVSAALMVGMRVRATFSDSRTRQTAFTPVAVKNWQRYGAQGVRLGPDDAAVTIVEFSDFTCPPCRAAATDLRDLRRLYPRSVALVY